MVGSNRQIGLSSTRKDWPLWGGIGVSAVLYCLGIAMFVTIWLAGRGQQGFGLVPGTIGQVLVFTLFQATVSMALSVMLGLMLAWSLHHRGKFPGSRQFRALLSISMVLPTLVVTLGLITVLGRQGWLNQAFNYVGSAGIGGSIYGLGGILTAHVFLNAPFSARLLLQRMDAVPVEKAKLGRSLGLSPLQRFRFIEWPALAASLPGLCITVFLLCFTSFAIVLVLGGSPNLNTLEVAIYEAIKLEFDIKQAVVLSFVQLVVCGVLVVAASTIRSEDRSLSVLLPSFSWPLPAKLRLLQSGIIVVLALAYLLPLLAVVLDGMQADFAELVAQPVFLQALMTSLVLASLSSVLTLAAALLISAARHRVSSPLYFRQGAFTPLISSALTASGTIFLAVPSLVMALGFFLIARQLASDVYTLAPAALLIANVLMALPFALVILYPAVRKSGLRHDRVSLSLGLSGLPRWRLVDFPAIRAEIGFVAALSFCFSFGDLGVISVFGNRDFSTLPWLLYQKMGSYRTSEAAGVALVMLSITFATFFVIPRLFEGRRHA
jgi:thiamine transport system permease protein